MSDWRRYLFAENPLCGPSGIARGGDRRRAWVAAIQMVLLSHPLILLIYFATAGLDFPDAEDAWLINLLAPHVGGMFIPLIALALVPRAENLRAVLTELRLAGLTPGQITAGHLRRAGQAVWRYQVIWLMIAAAIVASSPNRIWDRVFSEMLDFDDDEVFLWSLTLGALIGPWLMLGIGWVVLVKRGGLLTVAAVVIPVTIGLNPFAILLIGMLLGVDPDFDEVTFTVLDLICLLVKAALAAALLIRLHRRLDGVLAGER